MKRLETLFTILFLSFQSIAFCQMQDGATAPDWTLTDIYGNTHTLSDYLDQGKMVVLEFSATWCGPCWNYMLSGALETFWNEHGPDGADDAVVFYIESDWSTGMADLLGQTPTSQGNWVANISFPIIDLPSGNGTANQYQVAYYPTLYAVCHDFSVYELGQVGPQTWANFINSCGMEVDVTNLEPAYCVGDGSISVQATGGYSPYTYHWNTGANTPTISSLVAGTYNVTVTEAHRKITKLTVVVPGPEEPVGISDVSIEPALCFGSSNGSVSIDVEGGTPGYQYDWSNGASTQDLINVPADDYQLTITDVHGCTFEQSFLVDQPDILAVDVVTTPENCDQFDGTITLLITGGVGDYDISASEGTIYNNHVLDLPAGDVDLGVVDENGCDWADQATIEALPAPALAVTAGPELSCSHNTTTVTGVATGGNGQYSYLWTTADGHITSNPTSSTITVDDAGTYLLSIVDVISGCQNSNSAAVTANVAIPVAEAGEATPITCENLQVTLAGSGDTLNQVTWTTADGHIVEGGNTFHPVVDASGTYFVTIVVPATGCSNQDSVIVSNESLPATSVFSYQSSGLTVIGTDLSTGSNVTGWNWSFGDGSTSDQNNVVHVYAAEGTYEVCLSVQNGCGVNQSCQTVTVTSSGSVLQVDAVVTDVLCFGESTGSIVTTIGGGTGTYTFLWTGADTTFTTSSIVGVPAGVYQLVVSDDGGNVFIGEYTVNEPSILALDGSVVTDNLCFGQTNGSISVSVSGGISPYLFSWNGLPPQPENFLNQLPAGINQVVVTDANGCELTSGQYTISQPDNILLNSIVVMDASGPGESNGTITLDISGGVAPYQVLWSNGATGLAIDSLLPGQYNYTIIDANGCQFASASPVIVSFSTSVTAPIWPEYVNVTPNPSNGKFVIKWSALPCQNGSLSIYTTDGKLIDSHSMSITGGNWDLTSKSLSNGLYILLLKEDRKVYPYKLIVL